MSSSEIRAEQRYVDHAYARLAVMKELAAERAQRAMAEQQSTFAGKVERDVMVETGLRRLADLEFGDEPLVFGRMDTHEPETFYVGRVGVHDEDYTALVVDWRAPAAEPFYRATPRQPLGVVRRRHLICRGDTVVSISDELLDAEADRARDLVLVGEAALLRALERGRTGRMHDIVATIQAEQDDVIRSPMDGVLVVQGGPGTGKTAVALHRAAYLLYTHRRRLERDGVLLVGPNAVFLRYIEQVLPSLGERSVVLRSLGELYPDVRATADDPPRLAELKGDAPMAAVLASCVRSYERPLAAPVNLLYDGELFRLTPGATRRIVERTQAAEGPHNAKRAIVARRLVSACFDAWKRASKRRGDREHFVEAMAEEPRVALVLDAIWPLLRPEDVLRDLYRDPSRVRGLSPEDGRLLRSSSEGWTPADVALLDELSVLIGPHAARVPVERVVVDDEERFAIERMLDDLASADAETDAVIAPLIRAERRYLLQRYLDERAELDETDERHERVTYAHVVVDEAQDLSPMQWRVLARRCPDGSMTITGDLGQAASAAAPSSWEDVLSEATRTPPRIAELTINYRTPAEVMELAGRLLAAAAPQLSPPRSVRETGESPRVVRVAPDELTDSAARHADGEITPDGKVAVIAPRSLVEPLRRRLGLPDAPDLERPVVVLDAIEAKGLEFDVVVVVEPQAIADTAPGGLRALYVAMTRPTRRLVIVHAADLPDALTGGPGDAGADGPLRASARDGSHEGPGPDRAERDRRDAGEDGRPDGDEPEAATGDGTA